MKRTALALLFVLACAGLALAAQDGGAPAAVATPLWQTLLMGVISGLAAALMGWAKNRDESTGEMEPLEAKYLVPTIILGAILGLVAGLCGGDVNALLARWELLPVYSVLMVGLEVGWKVVFRHSKITIKDMLGMVKKGASNPPPRPPQPPRPPSAPQPPKPGT